MLVERPEREWKKERDHREREKKERDIEGWGKAVKESTVPASIPVSLFNGLLHVGKPFSLYTS